MEIARLSLDQTALMKLRVTLFKPSIPRQFMHFHQVQLTLRSLGLYMVCLTIYEVTGTRLFVGYLVLTVVDIIGGNDNSSSNIIFQMGSPIYPTSNRTLFNKAAGGLNMLIFVSGDANTTTHGVVDIFCGVVNKTDVPNAAYSRTSTLNVATLFTLSVLAIGWNAGLVRADDFAFRNGTLPLLNIDRDAPLTKWNLAYYVNLLFRTDREVLKQINNSCLIEGCSLAKSMPRKSHNSYHLSRSHTTNNVER